MVISLFVMAQTQRASEQHHWRGWCAVVIRRIAHEFHQ